MSRDESTVLVVDDESGIREVLSAQVEMMGFSCLEASDGQQALELVRTRNIDVIISDISMPNLTGVEFLQALRGESFTLPFIFVTGQSTVQTTVQALRLGAFDYIDKPFDLDIIEKLLAEAMRVSKEEKHQRTSPTPFPIAAKTGTIELVADTNAPRADQIVPPQNSSDETSDCNSDDDILHPSPHSPAHSDHIKNQMAEIDIFGTETSAKLTFCDASINALIDDKNCTIASGYLFRIFQSIREDANSLKLELISEIAHDFEECYLALRIEAKKTDLATIKTLLQATDFLRSVLDDLAEGIKLQADLHRDARNQLSNLKSKLAID